MSKKKGCGRLLFGMLAGAGIGMLFAPKKGSETRKELRSKLNDLWLKAKDIDVEELKATFQEKVDDIKREIDELDQERVLEIAKEKGKSLKKKAEELLELAKKKGTPVLEKTAKEIKDKSVIVMKETIKKLENNSKEDK